MSLAIGRHQYVTSSNQYCESGCSHMAYHFHLLQCRQNC